MCIVIESRARCQEARRVHALFGDENTHSVYNLNIRSALLIIIFNCFE